MMYQFFNCQMLNLTLAGYHLLHSFFVRKHYYTISNGFLWIKGNDFRNIPLKIHKRILRIS